MSLVLVLIAVIILVVVAAYFLGKARYRAMLERQNKEELAEVIKETKSTNEDVKNMSDSELDKHI